MSHPLCLVQRLIDQEKTSDFYLFYLFISKSKERVKSTTRSFDLMLSYGTKYDDFLLSNQDSQLIKDFSCSSYTSTWGKVFVTEF